jgi:hypothetical protein
VAHRKPLGTTWRGPIDWEGPLPALGDFLRSEAGTWYRIVGIEETANPKRPRLVHERVASPTGVEGRAPYPRVVADTDGAHRVHDFYWYPRERRL